MRFGRKQLGSYYQITADFQRDARAALERKGWTFKQLAIEIGVDPSSVSLLMSGDRVDKTSRIIQKVATALDIPLPSKDTDRDAKMLARLKALSPEKYRVIKDMIHALYGPLEKKH